MIVVRRSGASWRGYYVAPDGQTYGLHYRGRDLVFASEAEARENAEAEREAWWVENGAEIDDAAPFDTIRVAQRAPGADPIIEISPAKWWSGWVAISDAGTVAGHDRDWVEAEARRLLSDYINFKIAEQDGQFGES